MCSSLDSLAARGAERIGDALGNTWRWTLLHNAPDGQAVFAYTGGQRKLIGKFCQGNGGSNSFLALRALAGRANTCLLTPTPILYDEDIAFLVTDEAIGKSCNGMPLVAMSGRLFRIGKALKELHRSNADFGTRKSMSDHLHELVRPDPRIVAESLPRYSSIIHEALNQLSSTADEFRSIQAAPLHRDFHLRQLFDDGKFVCVVDWDLSAQGDPAFDVAYFTNYLRTHYDAVEAEAGVSDFLAGYDPDEGIIERLKTYELFNYLRRACRRFRLQDEQWISVLEAMLHKVKECLLAR